MSALANNKPDCKSRSSGIWKARKEHKFYDQCYKKPSRGEDGFFHCIREGRKGCRHKPTRSERRYYTFVDGHLKPFRCKQCTGKKYSYPANLSYHKRKKLHTVSVTPDENSTLDLDVDAVGLTIANKPEMGERESPTLANACQQSTEGPRIGSAGKIVEKCFSPFESRAAGFGHDDYQSDARVTDLDLATHLTNESNQIVSLSAPDSAAQISAHNLHDPLHKIRGRARARLDDLEKVEIDVLELLDVFQLPPKSLCDDLVQLYFEWVAPLIPLINKAQFMEQYNSTENPPSLLLLQAVLLAGSKAHDDLGQLESNGLPSPIIQRRYRHAKALYNANVEDDPVSTVQALTIMGWYCGDFGDTTGNSEHWTGIAIIKAQSNGMHQAVENPGFSKAEKRLRKRIWWTLFTLDRSIAMNRGRPALIYTAHCDIEPIGPEDFIESSEKSSVNPLHAVFSLQYIKLHSIIDKILSQQYRLASQTQSNGCTNITTCDTALNNWLQNCPKELYWESATHNFWSALLQTRYSAMLCFVHSTKLNTGHAKRELSSVTLRNAMYRIAAIAAGLHANKELQKCPVSFVNDLLRSLLTYVIDARINGVHETQQERAKICLGVLKELSGVWAIPKRQYTFLESAIQKDPPRDILNTEHSALAQETYRENTYSIGKDSWTAVYDDRIPHSVPAILQSPRQYTESWANIEQSNFRLLPPSQNPNIRFLPDTVLQPVQNPPQTPQIIQEAPNPWFGLGINGCRPSQLGMFEAPHGGNGTDAWGDIADVHCSAGLQSQFTWIDHSLMAYGNMGH